MNPLTEVRARCTTIARELAELAAAIATHESEVAALALQVEAADITSSASELQQIEAQRLRLGLVQAELSTLRNRRDQFAPLLKQAEAERVPLEQKLADARALLATVAGSGLSPELGEISVPYLVRRIAEARDVAAWDGDKPNPIIVKL